jgi:hypothetical protein
MICDRGPDYHGRGPLWRSQSGVGGLSAPKFFPGSPGNPFSFHMQLPDNVRFSRWCARTAGALLPDKGPEK